MLFAWLTLFVCYCFPTFKDLPVLPGHPFFERSAKVRTLSLLTKLFPRFQRIFCRDSQSVLLKNVSLFLRGVAKIRWLHLPAKLLPDNCSHRPHNVPTILQRTPFDYKRAAKIRTLSLPAMDFEIKNVKNQWNAGQIRVPGQKKRYNTDQDIVTPAFPTNRI